MNAKISVLVICVKTIIYLLLYNLHDCTFKVKENQEIKGTDIKTKQTNKQTNKQIKNK